VQPTDFSQVGFRVFGTGTARRNGRGTGNHDEDLVRKKRERIMKERILRLVIAFGAVVATALAGGASLRGL
jgi:hypothetical protein